MATDKQLDVWQVQLMHLRKRFHQRYRVSVADWEVDDMIRGIQLGRAAFAGDWKQGSRGVWAVAFRGEIIVVGYDTTQAMLTTVLPREDYRSKRARAFTSRGLLKWVHETRRHIPKR